LSLQLGLLDLQLLVSLLKLNPGLRDGKCSAKPRSRSTPSSSQAEERA
jgi:hypothetical protein